LTEKPLTAMTAETSSPMRDWADARRAGRSAAVKVGAPVSSTDRGDDEMKAEIRLLRLGLARFPNVGDFRGAEFAQADGPTPGTSWSMIFGAKSASSAALSRDMVGFLEVRGKESTAEDQPRKIGPVTTIVAELRSTLSTPAAGSVTFWTKPCQARTFKPPG
jgi:hypothetical protein